MKPEAQSWPQGCASIFEKQIVRCLVQVVTFRESSYDAAAQLHDQRIDLSPPWRSGLPHLVLNLRKLDVTDGILFPVFVIVVPPLGFIDRKAFRRHRRPQQFA
jgi:hypothetical protein